MQFAGHVLKRAEFATPYLFPLLFGWKTEEGCANEPSWTMWESSTGAWQFHKAEEPGKHHGTERALLDHMCPDVNTKEK